MVYINTKNPRDYEFMEMHVNGYTYDEIGEKYGIEGSAVKTRVHRWLKKVRKIRNRIYGSKV